MKYLTIPFFFVVQLCYSQDLILTKLTQEDSNRNVQYHYQWESTDGHVAIVDLFLFRDQTFEYSIASNVYNAYSIGHWKSDGKTIILNSDFQKETLPIKVSYRQRDTSDFTVKEVAFVKDLNEKPLSYAFVYINNDSTSCMDGDLLCIGEYKKIDRVKVVLENNGPSSKWINISPHDGLIQITVLTKLNLKRYIILKNRKYKLTKNKLKMWNGN
ncbi:MAG: hypothetical protein U0U70_10830 [Chitinophagaceae bacterium]